MVNKIAQEVAGPVTAVTTAETVLITSNPYVYDYPNPFVGGEHSGPGQGVTISGTVDVTAAGTAASLVTIRVRQGSITGAVVGGAQTDVVTAGPGPVIPYEAVDTSRWCAQAGGGVYVVTAQVSSATTNSTFGPITVDIEGA